MPLLAQYLYSVVTLPRFEPHQACKLGLDRPLVKLTIDQGGGSFARVERQCVRLVKVNT